jgi:hypothetical protein
MSDDLVIADRNPKDTNLGGAKKTKPLGVVRAPGRIVSRSAFQNDSPTFPAIKIFPQAVLSVSICLLIYGFNEVIRPLAVFIPRFETIQVAAQLNVDDACTRALTALQPLNSVTTRARKF